MHMLTPVAFSPVRDAKFGWPWMPKNAYYQMAIPENELYYELVLSPPYDQGNFIQETINLFSVAPSFAHASLLAFR